VLDYHKEVLGDYARREARAHLDRHDFAALKRTLVQARLGQNWHEHLCDYAGQRVQFDFEGAADALDRAVAAADGETIVDLRRLRISLDPFLAPHVGPRSGDAEAAWEAWFGLQRTRLGELFFNLRLKARQGAWVDVLGRLFRLQEAVLRLVFELETRHSTDKHPVGGFADFKQAVTVQQKILGERFKAARLATDVASSGNLRLALEYWVREGGKGREYGTLKTFLERACNEEMNGLRNKSIIAHGYQGVSWHHVQAVLKKSAKAGSAPPTEESLLEDLRAVLGAVGVSTAEEDDPFAVVRALLMSGLS
jgi:hypothetical protein